VAGTEADPDPALDARVYLKICTERLEAARKKIEVRGESEPTE